MVHSDSACSGVAFSLDTESGFRNVAIISASYGLGENVVKGQVNPDEFVVFKPTLKQGFRPIIRKTLGEKEMKMVYHDKKIKNIPTTADEKGKFCLTEDEILQLARWIAIIEDYYSERNRRQSPMDIEWAKDGITNQLYIVQARPETVHSRKDPTKIKKFHLKETNPRILAVGNAIGSGIGTGRSHTIKSIQQIQEFKKGEILVTTMTDPDWEPILSIASAIVTNEGGRTCHAAIISRELGIPCVVGCRNATENIKSGQEITCDCSSTGDVGRVLEGACPFETELIDLNSLPKIKTNIAMNIANPALAFSSSFLPVEGVGLIRMEFIISNHLRCHPMALLHPEKLNRKELKEISKLIKGYNSGKSFFIEHLSHGIGTIAAAFYPRRVIMRFSDFKTNEYASLLGGSHFEPHEANPMIGWRGASRYFSENYREGFSMECEAVLRVRNTFGLKNLQVMIPFIRTIDEVQSVIQEMESNGLKRNIDSLQVFGMCEVPSNVILADRFLDILDGFSIGSNDLTQLVLGIDRDSEILSKEFDERNEAVILFIKKVIRIAKKRGKYIGICGEAPSNYADYLELLVKEEINSISLNPDSILKSLKTIDQMEKYLERKEILSK